MSAPIWAPGTIYLTGAIVRPSASSPVVDTSIPNPGFEDGDTDWTKDNFTIVENDTPFSGTWCAKMVYSGGDTGAVTMQTPVACAPGVSITAACMILPTGAASGVGGQVRLVWYDGSGALLATSEGGNEIAVQNGATYRQSTVTATSPAGTAFVAVQADAFITQAAGEIRVDSFSWNYVASQGVAGLVYKAVQAEAGTSAGTEPVWPTTVGVQVVDGTVTWEAILTNRVTWRAIPKYKSGETEPTWPTVVGGAVEDGTIVWVADARRVEDERCPNSTVVTIAASKVFAADDDIIAFSATVNPLDWSSSDNAGYLPTGLQQYGANPMEVLGLYGSNLVAMNSQGLQMWQIDEDPANMALLESRPVGSTYHRAFAPVANDAFFLTNLGVRTIGIAGGSTNLQAGDAGAPIDPIIKEAIAGAPSTARATYFPPLGQYWLIFDDMYLTGDAPDTTVGATYSYQYEATGGVDPKTYAITSGTLPDGLSMSSGGLITGTPTTVESTSFTVRVTDANGQTASLADGIDVTLPAYVYAMAADNNVYVLDPDSLDTVETIAVGTNPGDIVMNHAGDTVYVSNQNSNTVSVIDVATLAVSATIAGFTSPQALAINADDSILYVENGNNTISRVDTATNTISSSFAVVKNYDFMALNDDGTRMYISEAFVPTAGGSIENPTGVFNTTAQPLPSADGLGRYVGSSVGVKYATDDPNTMDTAISTGNLFTLCRADNGDIYAADYTSPGVGVRVIDEATNTVTETIAVTGGKRLFGIAAGSGAVYVAEQPDSGTDGKVHRISTDDNTVTATATIAGSGAMRLACLAPE